jgi:hypothetical protein
MAIIYSYPVVDPTLNDLVLGTDVDAQGKPTKNFTIQSIVSLIQGSATGLEAVLADSPDGGGLNILNIGNITGSGISTSGSFADGTMTISSGIGTGFVSISSTDFVGDLTGVVKNGSSIQGDVTGVTQPVGTSNTKLATTKFVMDKVDPSVLQYLGDSTGPFDLNLVTDDFKISGTANQIETTATTVGGNVGTINLKFPTSGVTLPDGSIATTQALTDNSTKVATTAFVHGKNDAQDLDFTGDTGTSSVLLNSQTLDFEGTTNEVVTAVTAQKVKFSLPTDVTIGGIFTGATFSGDLNGTVNTATTGTTQSAGDDSTKIATTAYVDAAAGAKILQYQGDTGGPFDLNLKDDDLDIAGGSNISTTAATVATNLGVITIDLNDSVTISGTSKADTFTTTAGTATWVTTVLDGFTSITSTAFTGDLTGNASTATALASSGAIALTGDTVSTGGPYTYTSGGALSIATTIADTTVTGKVLTNLATPTSSAIAATDTILAAMAKLQGQITGLAGSLAFEGTWDARTVAEGGAGTPPSATPANGQFWIVSVAGSQDLDGITDWLVGDWAIYVDNGAGTDAWQKLDQSNEVLGSGAANKIAKWTSTNTLATGLITDDGTTVTVGNSGNFVVEGNTTLGDADTDSTTVKGPAVFEETLRINEGISLGAATYGTAGQVLTSGGGSASVNTWTTPTTGTVESVAAGDGIILTGDAVDPVVNVDYVGTDNVILSAGTAVTPVGADTIIINDATTGNVVKALISGLPFDAYNKWVLTGDTGTQDILSGNTVDIAGGTYITTAAAATDTLTITHDDTTRTDTTSTDAPAFGGTFDAVTSVTSNGTGHITAIDISTVTLPSPVDFTAGSAPGATAAVGTAGYVPAPAAGTGSTAYFLNGTGTMTIPPNDQGVTSVTATAPISSSGGNTPNITHDASGVSAGTYDSVTVDTKGHVTAGTNPGGSGGGIFSGDQAITTTAAGTLTFTLTRATTGTLIFDVWLTSETSTATSVAKKYVVAHSYNSTPVYNKVIDTGPGTGNTNTDDFTVQFIDSAVGATGTSCKCILTAVGAAQNIGYTVQVGHDSTNALTFTAAS